jgi:hypothetical protein
MLSWYDVESDHLLPYALIDCRSNKLALIKYNFGGEPYEMLLNYFSFHLDRKILTTTLRDSFQLL